MKKKAAADPKGMELEAHMIRNPMQRSMIWRSLINQSR